MLVFNKVIVSLVSLMVVVPSVSSSMQPRQTSKKVASDVRVLTEYMGDLSTKVQPHLDNLREASDSNGLSKALINSNSMAIADYVRDATKEIEPMTTAEQPQPEQASSNKLIKSRQTAIDLTSLAANITGLINSILTLTSSIISLASTDSSSNATVSTSDLVSDLDIAISELVGNITSIPTTGGILGSLLGDISGTSTSSGGLISSILAGIL